MSYDPLKIIIRVLQDSIVQGNFSINWTTTISLNANTPAILVFSSVFFIWHYPIISKNWVKKNWVPLHFLGNTELKVFVMRQYLMHRIESKSKNKGPTASTHSQSGSIVEWQSISAAALPIISCYWTAILHISG